MSRRAATVACVAGLLALLCGGAFWLGVALIVALLLVGLVTWARQRYSDPERAAARQYRREHPDYPFSAPTGRRPW